METLCTSLRESLITDPVSLCFPKVHLDGSAESTMLWLPSCDIPGSTVKVKNLDPVWDETFDLPVAKPEHASLEAPLL